MTNLLPDIAKAGIQLVAVSIAGGAVAYWYSRLQKRRDVILTILRDFTALHGEFLALRFRANSLYVKNSGYADKRIPSNLPLTEDQLTIEERFCFTTACSLIGRSSALKPILSEVCPDSKPDIELLFTKYHDWRRRLHARSPVLQSEEGETEDSYSQLHDAYRRITIDLRSAI